MGALNSSYPDRLKSYSYNVGDSQDVVNVIPLFLWTIHNGLYFPPDLQSVLSQRDQRVAQRKKQEQNLEVQQRVDLTTSNTNIQLIAPICNQFTRGSIVDIQG